MSEKRIFHVLDAIRGLLAILVMLRHIDDFIFPISFQETYLAVDVFFLLSGVVLCQAYEDKLKSGAMNAWEFFRLRVIRIYPLYLLGTLLGVISMVLLAKGSMDLARIGVFAAFGLLLLPYPRFNDAVAYPLNYPAWSLAIELATNVFYASVVRHLSDRNVWIIVGLSVVALLASIIIVPHHTMDLGWSFTTFPLAFSRIGVSFFLGVLMYRHFARSRPGVIAGRRGLVYAIAACGLIMALMMLSPPKPMAGAYDFVCTVLVIPAIVYFCLRLEISGTAAKIATFLGTTSYAIYAVHLPLSNLLRSLNTRTLELNVAEMAPILGVVFVAGMLWIAYILDEVFDKPVRRMLLRRPVKKATASA